MRALFVHYDLESTYAFQYDPAKTAIAWEQLASCLARDHVPGFSAPPRKRGKPSKLQDENVTLAMHVELLKRRDGLSDRKAIAAIVAQKLVSGSEQTLLKRYNRTKKLFYPLGIVLDNVTQKLGHQKVVSVLEETLLRGH